MQGLWIDAVLHGQDTCAQGGLVIVRIGGHCGLDDDRPVVHLFVHEMHGAPGQSHPVLRLLPLGAKAGTGREQSGMDVDHAPGKGRQERWRQDAHEPGQGHQLHTRFLEQPDQLPIEGRTLGKFPMAHAGRELRA